VTTFAGVLARRLAGDAAQPLVTYYDLATGERVELSVTTYANWVAKAASLLAEEHGLERGQSLRLDLPTHWLGPVFLGAAWTIGLTVSDAADPDAADPDAVVCGPDSVALWAPYAARLPVLACSLLPMGVRFADPLPAGVHDVGAEVWSQPDAFTPWDPPAGDDVATSWRGEALTHAELWSGAASAAAGSRLLSTANPASASGVTSFTVPLASGGSVVLVAGALPDSASASVDRVYDTERCTSRYVATS
jgi:uncharacterized protein (TIGR03089 family)